MDDLLATVREGKRLQFEAHALRADGVSVPVEVTALRINLGDRVLIQWAEYDISERVTLDKLREDQIAMVYHDLRSPLATVINSFELLESDPTHLEREMVEMVVVSGRRSADHLLLLIESLLDLKRLEQGQALSTIEPGGVEEVVWQAVEQAGPRIREAGHTLSLDLDRELPPVLLDREMIRRVILNLLENAAKYMLESGHITVTTRVEGDQPSVRVCVEDTGMGIPPEDQQYIFDKFARVQWHIGPSGLGLGLAFCKMAVEAHGGRIWVESEPGAGAKFCFTLPLASQGPKGG
jgi:signal transduction histidine kinase